MKSLRAALTLVVLAAVALVTWSSVPVDAQAPTIKIGLLYDHTGPFAAGGSLNCWRGAKMMIDLINEKGGVLGKYKIVQVDGDGQSKAEVAINEAERLLNVEKVDILAGIYSSAHAVPLAEKVDKQKRFLWITTAISSQGVRRPQPPVHLPARSPPATSSARCRSSTSTSTRRRSSRSPPRTLRLAIIHEDGAYGTDVAARQRGQGQGAGAERGPQGRLLDQRARPLRRW